MPEVARSSRLIALCRTLSAVSRAKFGKNARGVLEGGSGPTSRRLEDCWPRAAREAPFLPSGHRWETGNPA